jgi:uncharacterized phage protein (TIGR01671 family)
MKSILFRGKKENGEWVYGNYVRHTPLCVCFSGEQKPDKHFIAYDGYCDWGFEPPVEFVEVIPESVAQFTGLTDKNGKKIFEGDIVQGTIVSAWNKALIRCEVVYNKDGFISVERTRNQDWVHKVKFAKDIEVIGNIHDNKELLGE